MALKTVNYYVVSELEFNVPFQHYYVVGL